MLAVEKQTGETPATLRDKPRLFEWLHWYYEAFWMLDAGRHVYQGSIGRIPLTEIAAYMEIFEINDTDLRQLFVKTMKALDSVYVKQVNSKIKQQIESDRKDAERQAERARDGRR